MTGFLIFWLCLIPVGFFSFFLGLTLEIKKLKLLGVLVFALYFVIAIILFISSFLGVLNGL